MDQDRTGMGGAGMEDGSVTDGVAMNDDEQAGNNDVQAGAEMGTRKDDAAVNAFFSENALRVLEARYLKKDEQGECTEKPADMFRRVARAVAGAEQLYVQDGVSDPQGGVSGPHGGMERCSEWENRFFDLMVSQKFMPNSPTLMNAGREMGMLSACFVLPVPDSIDGIFDSIKYTALIQKAGGGTGFAFDELRPTGDYIKSSGGTTSGPISFWRAFSEATNAIQQGAFRRGANMGMMNIHHPDILKFLHAKEDLSQFTNYNISVKIPDEWMDAYIKDPSSLHEVENPRTGRRYLLPKSLDIWEYDLRTLTPIEDFDAGNSDTGGSDAGSSDTGDANTGDAGIGGSGTGGSGTGDSEDGAYYTRQDVWNIIINNAWRTGEPGVAFIDRINQANPTPHIGRMEATNPCGEQPLLPFEACNLGSINLAKFIKDPNTPQAAVDWDDLRRTIHESTRFLDDVIDANNYPLPQIDAICKNNRKIGLGIMGFADALYMLGVPYNNTEGIAWGERFMRFINDESHNYSEELARQRGSFPNWEGSIWDTDHRRPMRNATCTTVAPTGTISVIAGCSCGIEPMFSLVFYRNVLKGQDQGKKPMVEVNAIFKNVAQQRGELSEDLMDQIAREGTLAGIDAFAEDIRRVFVCAHDVQPEWHVKMQAAFQRHCDSSISKTINFSESATVEDVESIYRDSYRLGCKGVTVYRNGCRKGQPMALKDQDKKKANAEAEAAIQKTTPATRPVPEPMNLHDIACGVRIRQMTPFGNMHVQITVDPKTGQELEVFAQLGKGGDLANSDLEAICRIVSLWLRSNGRLHHVIRQLKGIGSSLQVSTKDGKVVSLGDGLARSLEKFQRAKAKVGIEALLLGRFDASDLDDSLRGLTGNRPANGIGNGNGKNANGNAKSTNGNGNGNGNGHGVGNGNGHGAARELAVAGASPGISRLAGLPTVESFESSVREEQYKVICPDCQNPLRFAEGCVKCEACGFSQC